MSEPEYVMLNQFVKIDEKNGEEVRTVFNSAIKLDGERFLSR